MDKFYVKPKKGLKAVQSTSATVSTTSRKSPNIIPATTHNRAYGVGKFYSKIRHTIEDNITPKISGKLYKAGKHSKSMTALSSLDSSIGKYTLTNKNSQPLQNKTDRVKVIKTESLSSSTATQNAPSISSYFAQRPSSYVDSDEDETQLSLSLAKTSLEDEIFEELEKVAHDESKLNAVLKTFDKIVFDYHEPPQQFSDSAQDEKNPAEEISSNISLTAVNAPKQSSNNPAVDRVCDKKFINGELSESTDQQQQNLSPALTDCHHETSIKKLHKSASCLSLTRRKCYQSPDSPCLRQMRHIFIQQQKQKSKSVWELSNSTKIPILKRIPLQKRSKSFCYLNTKLPQESEKKAECESVVVANSCKTVGKIVTDKKTTAVKRMNRANQYVNVRPTIKSTDCSNGPSKPKIMDTKISSRTREQNPAGPRRTNSNSSLSKKRHVSTTLAPHTPPRRSRTSDELLDKCLEKGQQILRKVESLNTKQHSSISAIASNNKSVVRIKSSSGDSGSSKNSTLKRKKPQPKLNYANEDKILPPSLESCKIIPPDFAEHSNKHSELLVNVVQVNNATRSLPQRQVSTDSGIATVSNMHSLDLVSSTVLLKTTEHESSFSDSDDSGHISNENMEITNNHQPSNSSSITSLNDDPIAGVNPVREGGDSKRELLITTANRRVCTTCRIAQVESVKVIRTHVEIFPNFTKEVTIRLQ
ncbi:uncharacterized protein LOC133335266 [Musca vetustissima]|uniref:uncharacterized protein LOC133335266 n=1 Tax=Musca vetustissima TaxID=27455 RepID=UPI002AB61A71|nr:uncharacterized protein LOC133335266 [Musca vetustissima]